ncbi:acetyl-CoA C-acetyltransferase [Segniliparus rugosus ATCC BAA-974]|uniref:Acetyl-CoA C-acetyltransferase n=1 Tax=Segniliparus rugosus (strain ATCC BAA-974 / DSM 45345 / CCUG 50838 / CIP 108380 / JCM 13579 / CDC 945) TaxID=679197 RepID=E5XRN8_SEGRC|nr:acetyl-CoA C-acetyltransferase [Segniliparus rugosus]EFV13001.1 acetyl-CoA C-acetyltransferase [Segniliparus rugosus ATCC BAA-974]
MATTSSASQRRTRTRSNPAPQTGGAKLGRPVAVLGGNRTPFARSFTAYKDSNVLDMLTAALQGLVNRFDLHGEQLGAVVGGGVAKDPAYFNLTREAVLSSGLSPYTPTWDLQQACGTSLRATADVANEIALGRIEVGVGSGVDSYSIPAAGIPEGLIKIGQRLQTAKSLKERLQLIASIRPGSFALQMSAGERRTGLTMGESAAITSKQFGITRQAQDELALASHKNLAAAYERGFFDDLITPYQGLVRDNNLRPDLTLEKLAKLKPVFGVRAGDATMTAGNSTAFTDGAAAALLSSDEWAAERGLPVLAHLVDVEVGAVDYVSGTDGLLMAGTYAVPRLLARNGLALQDFDVYEIHEAFASVVLCHLKAWSSEEYCKEKLGLDAPLGEIDRSKLNTVGSSLGIGHPFGATGARVVAQVAKQLAERGSGRALVSICEAGGQGITAILER